MWKMFNSCELVDWGGGVLLDDVVSSSGDSHCTLV